MNILFSITATIVCMLSMPSYSLATSGLGFASKSPISFFTPEDSKIFKHTLFDTLDHQPDGKTIHWENSETKHSGKMKVVQTYTKNNTICRTMKLFNQAEGTTGKAQFDFCKQQDNTWKAH